MLVSHNNYQCLEMKGRNPSNQHGPLHYPRLSIHVLHMPFHPMSITRIIFPKGRRSIMHGKY